MLKILTFIKWLKIEKVSLCYFSYASIEEAKILGLYVTRGALSTDERYGCWWVFVVLKNQYALDNGFNIRIFWVFVDVRRVKSVGSICQ